MPLDDRKLEVLRAIVEDYVATREPVGSRALVERHKLNVSPATVRNDMAVLEEEGYIRQPHTSAGRVPTDRGYRLFVDRLSKIKPLSAAERRAIERFMVGAVDLDDVVHRTVRLLAQLTQQVAVVQYPSLTRSAVRHLELVSISTTRMLLVVITDTGRVEQRVVELPGPTSDDDIAEMRRLINAQLGGRLLSETPQLVQTMVDEAEPNLRAPMASLGSVLLETLVERHDELQDQALDSVGARPLACCLPLLIDDGPRGDGGEDGYSHWHSSQSVRACAAAGVGWAGEATVARE